MEKIFIQDKKSPRDRQKIHSTHEIGRRDVEEFWEVEGKKKNEKVYLGRIEIAFAFSNSMTISSGECVLLRRNLEIFFR